MRCRRGTRAAHRTESIALLKAIPIGGGWLQVLELQTALHSREEQAQVRVQTCRCDLLACPLPRLPPHAGHKSCIDTAVIDSTHALERVDSDAAADVCLNQT